MTEAAILECAEPCPETQRYIVPWVPFGQNIVDRMTVVRRHLTDMPYFSVRFCGVVGKAVRSVLAMQAGRVSMCEMDPQEKKFIGTKFEHGFRSEFGVGEGEVFDCVACGVEFDLKMTVGKTWMIPPESYECGGLCLLAQYDAEKGSCRGGLLYATPENLTRGRNRDRKLSVSAAGAKNVAWIASGPATARWECD